MYKKKAKLDTSQCISYLDLFIKDVFGSIYVTEKKSSSFFVPFLLTIIFFFSEDTTLAHSTIHCKIHPEGVVLHLISSELPEKMSTGALVNLKLLPLLNFGFVPCL